MAPSTLVVIPDKRTLVENKPFATILDNKPFVNILPFGLCTSLANPITAAQTAAALGVLTPGTCTPVMPAPWVPGSPTMLVGNTPALTQLQVHLRLRRRRPDRVPGHHAEQLP